MSFIGIVSNNKDFEIIKNSILKNINDKKLNIININKQSIDNMQNIKFETIVITEYITEIKNKEIQLNNICRNLKYLVVNSDIKMNLELQLKSKINIITYGLNQKSTITISSVREENILISIQRSIKSKTEKIIEMGEKSINLEPKSNLKIYDILIIYSILAVYDIEILHKL